MSWARLSPALPHPLAGCWSSSCSPSTSPTDLHRGSCSLKVSCPQMTPVCLWRAQAASMPPSSQYPEFRPGGRRGSVPACHWEQFCQQHFNIQVILTAAGTSSPGSRHKNSFIKQITSHLHILCIKAHTWMLTLKAPRVQVWSESNKGNSKQCKSPSLPIRADGKQGLEQKT